MGARVGGAAHRPQPGRVGEQGFDELGQPFAGALAVRQQQAGARVAEHPGVVRLVIVRRVRVGHQDGGHAGARQFRHGGRAGPADHQVGRRVGEVHPVQVGHGGGHRTALQPGPDLAEGGRAGLDQQAQVVPVPPAPGQLDGGLGQAGGAQAAAVEHHQVPARRHAEVPPGLGAQRRPVQRGHRADQGHADGLGRQTGGQVRAGAVEGERRAGEPGREAVGPPGHGVRLVHHAGQLGEPGAHDHRRAGVAAHPDRHLRALGPQDLLALAPRAQQRGGQQVPAQAEEASKGIMSTVCSR